MKTPHPQQEFQKLGYLKALGIQPLVLVRQPACGAILPRAVPTVSEVDPEPSVSSDARGVVLDPSAKRAHGAGGDPTASLAAVRESLMGSHTRSDPADTQARTLPEIGRAHV